MTILQLRYLEKILEAGSYHAAGRELGKSQPALSIAIGKLEKELGFQLFDRSAYRATLTDRGIAFYESARELLENHAFLTEKVQLLRKGREARLAVSVDVMFPQDRLSRFLSDFQEQFPSTRLDLRLESLAATVISLESGSANLAILTPLVLNTDIPLEKQPLGSCRVIPCIQAKLAVDLTARRLARINQLILGDDGQESDGVAAGLLRGGRKWRVNDLHLKAGMICAGLGWGYLPLPLATVHLESGQLTQIDLPSVSEMKVDFILARRTDRVIGPIAAAAWSLLLG